LPASLAWVSWIPLIGFPNCSRWPAYSSAAWKELRAAPIAPHRMPYRASLRQDSGPMRPRTSGNTASWGRRTPSRTSSLVTDALNDNLCLITVAENPGVSVGTTNPRIPSSVWAQMTACLLYTSDAADDLTRVDHT